MNTHQLSIAWTTVSTEEEASDIAQTLLDKRLAACVHIEGPIQAYYRWDGKIHNDPEYRLMIKFPTSLQKSIEQWINKHHPYDTPQWIVVKADATGEAYAKWVNECC